MKQRPLKGFGQRLAQIRKARGMTQRELGTALGVSPRVIVYYERDDSQPPGAMLLDLAKVLRVSTDELLGLRPFKQSVSPRDARLLKRLERIRQLPKPDQQALLKFLDALVDRRKVVQGKETKRQPALR